MKPARFKGQLVAIPAAPDVEEEAQDDPSQQLAALRLHVDVPGTVPAPTLE
jgi:hypothetical protein